MAVRPVIDAWMETHNVRTLRFDWSDQPPVFWPGQFVMISDKFRGYEKPVRRAYSIASTPLETNYLDVTVKRENPGLMSVRLTEVPIGYEMEVQDPAGKYLYEPKRGKRILLLGAGSGVVPLYSIARFALESPVPGAEVLLFFSVRTPQDIIYQSAWEELAKKHPNFHYHLTVTRASADEWQGRRGRITPSLVRELEGDVSDTVAYICGPGPMVVTMEEVCRELGLPEERINSEKW